MDTIFIVLDHGLAVNYFLETGITEKLSKLEDIRIVFVVQEAMLDLLSEQYSSENIIFESIREDKAKDYANTYFPRIQEMFEYVRRAIASTKISLGFVDIHRQRKEYEAKGKRRIILRLLYPVIYLLRRSKASRLIFRRLLSFFFTSNIYTDLFEKYQPRLVVSNTAGWRFDQYLLREANKRKIRTLTVIIGWDNPSSQGLPGAFIDYVNVWSRLQKIELAEGVDWPKEKINIGGMPLYDGYITNKWLIGKEEYFELHKLDPGKKLIGFAATALSMTPNLHIIKILADIVSNNQLDSPAQLLVRLHPNHFKKQPHYEEEREAIFRFVHDYPNVHVVEPTMVPGGLERYSGEDFPEKASMLYYCHVLTTIYSTMVVESALLNTPFINVCIDPARGWENRFSIPLSEVSSWPTASRVIDAKAGRTVYTVEQLITTLNKYLSNPLLDHHERSKFVLDELTYIEGEATENVALYIQYLAERGMG